MEFWKEHVKARVVLIALFFIGGLILVFAGWKMTGKHAWAGTHDIGRHFIAGSTAYL